MYKDSNIKQMAQTQLKPQKQFFNVEVLESITVQNLLTIYCTDILTPSFRKIFRKDLAITLFVIKVNHGQKQWKLHKRIYEMIDFQSVLKKKYKQQIPAIPVRKQHQINNQNKASLVDFFNIFIKKVVNVAFYDPQFIDFFNFFPIEFGNGIIYSQIQLKKHSGGRHTEATCAKKIQNTCCRNWRNRWFTVTDQGVFYTIKRKTYIIKQMLNFSHHFKIYCGLEETGKDLGIQIKSAYRTLELKAQNMTEFAIFISTLKRSYSKSPHKDIHRFSSFSSIKKHCKTEYYIDGQQYFEAVHQQILKAKKYVYITDWMMTPYFQLKRPSLLADRSCRLDYILQQLALKGVKIYIILYMQPKIALNNDSQFVQNYFHALNKNIKVLRHPNYILIPFLWSHHEKIIVIDQKVAFLGGLDMCYGRWDTQQHQIIDSNYQNKQLWKGADFCNFRLSDIYSPRNFLVSNIDKKSQPRMPWHDICVKIQGGSVHDLARHFIQYWNFVNFQTKFDQRQLLMHAGIHSTQKVHVERQKTILNLQFSKLVGVVRRAMIPRTKKSSQLIQGMIQKSKFQQQISQKTIDPDQIEFQTQRQQKNQETIKGEFQYYDRYLQDKNKKLLPNIQIPKIDDIKNYSKKIQKKLKDIFVQRKFNQVNTDSRLIITHQQQTTRVEKKGKYSHQILRSASTWSLGLDQSMPESSIYHAYLDMIKNSKYYIYIQNQFFISVQNKVCQALIERIDRAFRNKQKFKVMILMPLLPGFEGDITNESSSSVMRVQLYWQYRTLCRSKNSLFQKLSHIPLIDDYLKVYSLRQHGLTPDGIAITQQLYIHSKLMIIDDERVILGSANINDRSLLGDRDSQIAIIIQNQQLIQDCYGRLYSKSAKKLRVDLYVEHFAFTKQQCQDFHDQVTWKEIRINAKNNTEIYRTIYGCYPDDQMKVIADVQKIIIKQPKKQVYQEQSIHIKGHVVQFPLKFLQKQNLNLKMNQPEYFIPFINFT